MLTRTDFRVPQHATADLAGATVVETVSRGKHLLTRIDAADGPLTLHTHLKMEGSWRVLEPGQRWSRPAHEIRVVLETARGTALGCLLGVVELLPRERETDVVGHLGPDLLGPDWDEAEALRRLTPSRTARCSRRCATRPGWPVSAPSTPPRSCFVMGVAPATPVGEVPDLPRLVRRVRQMLDQEWSRSRPMWVYRQRSCADAAAARCASIAFGPAGQERTAYWCPSCQPLRQPS